MQLIHYTFIHTINKKILSNIFQIRYTGFRDRPQDERRIRFQNGCREGHTEVSFTVTGINLQLVYNPNVGIYTHEKECDFDKEHGKVSHSCLFRNEIFIGHSG